MYKSTDNGLTDEEFAQFDGTPKQSAAINIERDEEMTVEEALDYLDDQVNITKGILFAMVIVMGVDLAIRIVRTRKAANV